MINWHALPFARVLLPFILAVLSYFYAPEVNVHPIAVSFGFLVLIIGFYIGPSHLQNRFYFLKGVFLFCMLYSVFYLRVQCNDNRNHKDYFQKTPHALYYKITCGSRISEKKNHYNTYASIEAVIDSNFKIHKACGIILLKLPKSLCKEKPQSGDYLLINTKIEELPNSTFPETFDYKSFLSYHHVYQQFTLKEGNFLNCKGTAFNIYKQSHSIRNACIQVIQKWIPEPQVASITEALVLGSKDDLQTETTDIFSRSGTMHVLAVSGLHTGIIYMILLFVTGPLKKKKLGIKLQFLIILTGIWFYAIITGLTASVIRASLMFSFISIASVFNLKKNALNNVYASAFIMMMVEPNYLFDLGFQLSYAAVLGILYIHPKIKNCFQIKNKLVSYIIDLSTVSIAAQVFTFPLCVYYFKQFPSYFILSNILVIPLFTVVLILGILLLSFAWLPLFASGIGLTIHYLIEFNFYALDSLLKLPFSNIYISGLDKTDILIIYILVFSILAHLNKPSFYRFAFFIVSISLLGINHNIKYFNMLERNEILTKQLKNSTVTVCITNQRAYLIKPMNFKLSTQLEKKIKLYLKQEGISDLIEVENQKAFVSTNFLYVPRIGFKFFDKIMTKENTVHLSIHRIN